MICILEHGGNFSVSSRYGAQSEYFAVETGIGRKREYGDLISAIIRDLDDDAATIIMGGSRGSRQALFHTTDEWN